MARAIEIVVNPASGSRLGPALVEQHIRPLLVTSLRGSKSIDDSVRIRETKSEADGVRIGREIVRDWLVSAQDGESVIDIVAIGGDGTTHELLNGLYLEPTDATPKSERGKLVKIRLAIVPAGTANALYSAMYPDEWTQQVQHQAASAGSIDELDASVLEVMLKSVRSLASCLDSEEEEAAAAHQSLSVLPLMLNRLESGDGEAAKSHALISHLVTSHALHAAILHDADTPEMRAQHPGIERFKAAAQMNATRWTEGRLTLHAIAGAGIQRYSPSSQAFEPIGSEQANAVLEGPFLYLNAMVTDRLESAFLPAPLSSAFADHSLPMDAIDVVAIRPKRDPSLSADVREAAVQFASTKLGEITAGMYSAGKHIDLTYSTGEPVVEYFRCAGYRFEPAGAGAKQSLVCTDGFISSATRTTVSRWREAQVETGGRIELAAPLVWR